MCSYIHTSLLCVASYTLGIVCFTYSIDLLLGVGAYHHSVSVRTFCLWFSDGLVHALLVD